MPDWSAGANWACLTGTAQIACCWLLLSDITRQPRYASAAFKANEFLRRSVRIDGPPEMRGAVKGSLPVSGGYGRYQYLSWAGKFLADSLILEMDLRPPIESNGLPGASIWASLGTSRLPTCAASPES